MEQKTYDLLTRQFEGTLHHGQLDPRAVQKDKPWGFYIIQPFGPSFIKHPAAVMTKILGIKQGHRFSLQKHFKRSEHWTLLSPSVIVTLENEHQKLQDLVYGPGHTFIIPEMRWHRAHNVGDPIAFIYEEMIGVYDEDDIVRLDDDYGRT